MVTLQARAAHQDVGRWRRGHLLQQHRNRTHLGVNSAVQSPQVGVVVDYLAFVHGNVLVGIGDQQSWKLRLKRVHFRLELLPLQAIQIARQGARGQFVSGNLLPPSDPPNLLEQPWVEINCCQRGCLLILSLIHI